MMRRASHLALLLLAPYTHAADWLTRWDDGECVSGARGLDVLCVDDDLRVDESNCAATRPAPTVACTATTVYIDAALGDDDAAGTAEAPLATLSACVRRFGVDLSSTKTLPADDEPQLVCAMREGVYRHEASTPLAGVDHLLVRPASDGDLVVFDGTDPVDDLSWSPHGTWVDVVSAPLAATRPEVLVGGRGLMCANESAISDGNHEDKPGYGTARAPCFVWEPTEAWVDGGAAFALDDAVAYYERGEPVEADRNLPWFWMDQRADVLHVDAARAPDGYEVRLKNASRADALAVGDASHRVYVRDVLFYGATCCGAGPSTSSLTSQDLRVLRSRFLFAPKEGVRVKTTKQTKRGGTPYAAFVNNTVEFSEGALMYKGTGATIRGNYLAFNSFEARGSYTLDNMAQRSVVTDNTLFYNGDKGGHFSWARGHRVRRNLVIGQDFLGPRFDAAVFHALTGAQDDLVIERNWVLGPSLVSFARLDTASSTPPEDAGRYTTIKHNVHVGLGLTTKGYNHTVEHNTGSRFLQVEAWKVITNHNYATVARFNAHSEVASRASTAAHGAIPGLAALNLCDDLRVCNPDNATAPASLARQLRPLTNGVTAELVAGAWPGVDTSGVGEGAAAFNEAGVVDGDELLGIFEPHEIATPVATDMDFRPRVDGRLALACGGECGGDGATYGYRDEPPSWAAFDDYVGAYAPDEALWVPGCYGCAPGGTWAGGVFPWAPGTSADDTEDAAAGPPSLLLGAAVVAVGAIHF